MWKCVPFVVTSIGSFCTMPPVSLASQISWKRIQGTIKSFLDMTQLFQPGLKSIPFSIQFQFQFRFSAKTTITNPQLKTSFNSNSNSKYFNSNSNLGDFNSSLNSNNDLWMLMSSSKLVIIMITWLMYIELLLLIQSVSNTLLKGWYYIASWLIPYQ